MYTGPNIERDGLVFGYDTGYGVADNSTATRFYKGKPVVNMLSYGDDFNSWTKAKNSGSYPTINTKIKEGPIAGTMADRLSLPSDGSYPRIYQNFTPTSTTAHVFSVWLKGETTGQGCFVGAFRNSPWSSPSSTNFNITTEWVKYSFSINPADTTSHQIYIGSHNSHGGKSFLISKAQLAPGTISSPFTNGTRSSTDALIDLKKSTNIDLSNVSFDSTGQPVFDGTDDFIRIPDDPLYRLTSTGTLEVLCKPTDLLQGQFAGLVGQTTGGSSGQQAYYLHWRKTSNQLRGGIATSAGVSNLIAFTLPTDTNWIHLVFTWDGSFLNLYRNGISAATPVAQTINAQVLSTNVDIGGRMFQQTIGTGGGEFNGQIPIVKIYNQALSAEEVKQNFNAYKNRFNL